MLESGFHNMGCMDGMSQFPDKYFELAIVDPPYGINVNMNIGMKKGQAKKREQKKWDNSTPDDRYFKELFRISKNQVIWGGELLLTSTRKMLCYMGQGRNDVRQKFRGV